MKRLHPDLLAALAALLLFAIFLPEPASAAEPDRTLDLASLTNQLLTLDPHSDTNLTKLASITKVIGKGEKKASKKKPTQDAEMLKNLPAEELRKIFVESPEKYDSRAFSTIGRLANEALQASNPAERAARERDIAEVQAAVLGARLPLVPEKLGFFTTWIFFFKNSAGTIGRGDSLASNLSGSPNDGSDEGRRDPMPSTFWTRPNAIGQENLYAGFGRESIPHLEEGFCEYSGPKTSSGTHAGFDVDWNGERYKIKFGEVNSEPFTARIFDALGYHADATDYAPRIKMHYNRRVLREFHCRRPLDMGITPFGVHISTVHLQTHFDPFTFITRAVFKDGHELSGMQLKQALFKNPSLSHPEDSPQNFRPEVEAKIDYLVWAPANVQLREGPTQSLGCWQFGGLGHENLRELRGAGLLAAWLAFFDTRTDNTKLRIERDSDEVHLLHFISDLGGGMGQGAGLFSPHGENPNDFTWTFTAPEIVRGPGRMTTPFHIEHFKPTVPTPAFAAMTTDDARWMARLIGQLTENQLRAALIGAGYDNAEAQLYLEKLISRRDQMIRDLKMENEIPLLRPNGQDREFSYVPAVNGAFEGTVGGMKVTARESGAVISRGELVQKEY